MKKSTFLFLLVLTLVGPVNAQNYWKKSELRSQKGKSADYLQRDLPSKYQVFSLDIENFTTHITSTLNRSSQTLIALPSPNGKLEQFYLKETPVFEEGLSAKFPTIKSYTAVSAINPGTSAKISLGTDGVHVLISSYDSHDSYYVDPYSKDRTTYIAYKRSDYKKVENTFECLLEDEKIQVTEKHATSNKIASDSNLRTYRIAIACTGEYAQYHLTNQGVPATATIATKKAAVLSAMNTTITRVNQIYERDMAVKMVLVNDNDKIIFLDAETDNLSNDNANALIDESQTVCDTNISSANYDIGHTFSTGAGGLAALGVVCTTGQKGRGITGTTNPINDPYDIDYVAHEIGHQFGATHTFNNPCSGNRSSITAVEPGSGSTIMAYAGICSPNVQFNSDAYFHAVSIKQIWNTIQSSATCATLTDTKNAIPTAAAGSDVSIPKSTPFVLKGTATDADGTSGLTYNWEQIDNEVAVMPPVSSNSGGPMFRSLPSKTTPVRYFPDYATVLAGNTSTDWEVLPSVARAMNFSFTVRDNNAGGGGTARDDIKVTVVDATPFSVSNQATWAQNTSRAITWVVGQSNVSPINCLKVNIKLSTDGGNTFPINLALNTDNDGEEQITLPTSVPDTENAVLLIEAVDNIFYNITPKFTVSSKPDFVLANKTGDVSICNIASTQVAYDLDYTTSNGFTETVTLTVAQKPTNSQVVVSPTSISTDGSVQVQVSNLGAVASGDHDIVINAKSTSSEKNITLKLTVSSGICASEGNMTYNTSTTLVKFNTIQKITTTKESGYNNFKSISTTVKKAETHQLTVNADTDGDYTTKTFAWIDWNQNCTLDSNEKYDLGTATNSSNAQTSLSPLNITIPNDAKLGSTTLRVSTKFSGDGEPQPCEHLFDGEVEDYTIVIEETTASIDDSSFSKFNLFPNPTSGLFKLIFETKNSNDVSLKLFDVRGRLIEIKNYRTNSLLFTEDVSFTTVSSGLYLLQIENGSAVTTRKLIIK